MEIYVKIKYIYTFKIDRPFSYNLIIYNGD